MAKCKALTGLAVKGLSNRIIYQMVVVTFNVQDSATPAYLSHHKQIHNYMRNLWSSSAGSAVYQN